MTVKEARALRFEVREQDGSYPVKPRDAKTVKQWIEEGRKPISAEAYSYYEMPSKRGLAYAYVRECDTVPLSAEELELQRAPSAKEAAAIKKEREASELIQMAVRALESERAIVFDTETTGFSPAKGDEILQLSVVRPSGEVLFDSYFKPVARRFWPDAEAVHKISPSDVENAPRALDFASEISALFSSASAIIGHNVSFDVRFVEATFGIEIPKEKVIDTMKLFKACAPDADSCKLESVVERFAPSLLDDHLGGAHSSLVDAKSTAAAFSAMARSKAQSVEKPRSSVAYSIEVFSFFNHVAPDGEVWNGRSAEVNAVPLERSGKENEVHQHSSTMAHELAYFETLAEALSFAHSRFFATSDVSLGSGVSPEDVRNAEEELEGMQR